MPCMIVDADLRYRARLRGCAYYDFGTAIDWLEHEAHRHQRPE